MFFFVQVCYHIGGKTDPDLRDEQTDKSDIDILKRFVARCVPGLVPEPAVVESCMYTVRFHADQLVSGQITSYLWVDM